ncbi:hypothetical protein [Micromonospora sp. BRA006-A]|uniref:hypothetical protein n=1 Tax=Micromonospora sp. BRA006-A TaxID=2962860 RepID=UPI0039904581
MNRLILGRTLIVGAVFLAGLNLRTRRLYVLSLEERAATLEREREREREAEARAAVTEERTRIARELHDVADTGRAALEEMRRLAAPLASVLPAHRALSRPVVASLGAD